MSTNSAPGRRARMATTGRFVKPPEPMTQERLDAMVERAARAMMIWGSHRRTADEWGRLPEASRELWRMTARVALEAALGAGEEA